MKKLIFVGSVLFSVNLFALSCPKSFQEVKLGSTEQQVLALCGQPQSKSKPKNVRKVDNQEVEIWSYGAKKYYDARNNGRMSQTPQINVAFSDGKVSGLTVSGAPVNSVNACGTTITVGQTSQSSVQASCGSPNFTSSRSQKVSGGKGKSSQWIYQFNPYQPKKTFIFFNGKLESIQ